MAENKTGPTDNWKQSSEVVRKLEDILGKGGSIKIACIYAGISRDTYYRWCREDPEFSDKMERSRNDLVRRALTTMYKDIDTNPNTAKFALKHLSPELYGNKKDEEDLGRDATFG